MWGNLSETIVVLHKCLNGFLVNVKISPLLYLTIMALWVVYNVLHTLIIASSPFDYRPTY